MEMECKKCGKCVGVPEAIGCFSLLPYLIMTGVVIGPLFGYPAHYITHYLHLTFWYKVLFNVPIVIICGALALKIPALFTYARYGFSKCQRCGAKNWSAPRYTGIGL
jgi:hypothetical protein